MTSKTTYRLDGKIRIWTHPFCDVWETVNQCDGDIWSRLDELTKDLPGDERTAYRYDRTFAEAVVTHERVVALIDAALLANMTALAAGPGRATEDEV
jgi:predicted RNA-binding protein with PUA domain